VLSNKDKLINIAGMKFNNVMVLNLRLNNRQQKITSHITPAPIKTFLLTMLPNHIYTS